MIRIRRVDKGPERIDLSMFRPLRAPDGSTHLPMRLDAPAPAASCGRPLLQARQSRGRLPLIEVREVAQRRFAIAGER